MIPALDEARRVMLAESSAIARVAQRLGPEFERAVVAIESTMEVHGTVHVAGVGKSGHIASHLAAKLCSIHVPAYPLSPTDALHGDLGRFREGDTCILISRSGACIEIITLAGALRMHTHAHPTIIGITAHPGSGMGVQCDIVIDCEAGEEACPFGLVPTVSTAVAVAVSDALVLSLMERSGFQPEHWLRTHPGGPSAGTETEKSPEPSKTRPVGWGTT